MNNTTEDLVQEGLTAARVGDVEDARRLVTAGHNKRTGQR